MKEWEKLCHENINQMKAEIVTLISDRVNSEQKNLPEAERALHNGGREVGIAKRVP